MPENVQRQTNRLINEKSPYLLQHAHNPVDWFPWCEEAFEKAKKEDKPILLSIGYSTCHWCHVMEKESFEDEDVAKILNNNYISIKVDKEERPDVDSVYMNVCQTINGSGGWPLTVIMTPEKKPFFVGTYFPKESKYGRRGFTELLNYLIGVWRDDKKELLKNSEYIMNYINQSNIYSPEPIDIRSIENTFEELRRNYDVNYGGFSIKPKFPSPQNIYFLLRYYKQTGSKKALSMATKTLDSMYKGGIFDHIGYGFSRYSTDEKWLVPHFEKMLYDNALLAIAYGEAYVITRKELYKDIVDKIFSYVLRDMQHEGGAFYCAEDADSEGVEGKFYLWSKEEIKDILGEEDSKIFCQCYDISSEGNFEGENIPNLIQCNLEELYKDKELKDRLEDINKRLFEIRERRIHPHKDDKILTSWNGMMIAALAYCGRVLENDTYIENARRAAGFIYKHMFNNQGRLLARYRKGEVKHLAYIDDYAFLLWGLLELYEATFKVDYLKKAVDITKDMEKYFWDDKEGAFFLYGIDGEELIWRPKEVYDGAIPSGNSVAALNILRLARITKNMDFERMVSRMFTSLGGKIQSMPSAYAYFMIAVMYGSSGGKEIIVSGEECSPEVQKIQKELSKEFLPFSVLVLNDEATHIKEFIPHLENHKKIDGKTTVYLCQNFSCKEPLTDIDKVLSIIKGKELDIHGYYPDLNSSHT